MAGLWLGQEEGKGGSTASYATARQFNQDDMARSIAVLDSAILALIHKVLAPRTCPKMKNNNCAAQSAPQLPEKNYEKFINVKVCTASQMGTAGGVGEGSGGKGSTRKETSNNVNYMPVAAATVEGDKGRQLQAGEEQSFLCLSLTKRAKY